MICASFARALYFDSLAGELGRSAAQRRGSIIESVLWQAPSLGGKDDGPKECALDRSGSDID
jgi:hypothetical protein